MYSTNAQILHLEIELDNGSNSANYYKTMNERKTIVKEYNEQLNINSLTDIEEVGKYIQQVKDDIQVYKIQIEELLHTLKDTSTSNVVKKNDICIDKTLLEENIKRNNLLLQESFPVFLVVLICCVGLFIGKFLTRILIN